MGLSLAQRQLGWAGNKEKDKKKQKKRPSSYKMKYEKQSSFLKNLQKTIFY